MKAITSLLRGRHNAVRDVFASPILQQAGWLAVAKITQGVASIVASLVIARHLGPTGFGQLSLAIAIASFVGMMASLGLEHIATRELAMDEDVRRGTLVTTLRRLRFGGAVIGSFILLAITYLPATERFGISGLLMVLCLLPIAQVGDLAEWQLITGGRGKRIAVAAITLSPLVALARIGLAVANASIVAFAWMLVLEWLSRSIFLILSTDGGVFRSSNASPQWVADGRSLLRDSMPLLMAGIAVFIYMRIDQFMIASLLNSRQVGLYSSVVTLSEIPLILPALLLRGALPTLTRQSALDPALRDRTLAKLMRHVFYLHLAGAIVLLLVAQPLIRALYGEPFAEAAGAFRLQVLAAPFVALGVLSSAWLVLEHRTRHALRRTIIGAIANILLNLAFIPRFGISGAAAATLIAQILSTYLTDLTHPETRAMFKMKTLAIIPGLRAVL